MKFHQKTPTLRGSAAQNRGEEERSDRLLQENLHPPPPSSASDLRPVREEVCEPRGAADTLSGADSTRPHGGPKTTRKSQIRGQSSGSRPEFGELIPDQGRGPQTHTHTLLFFFTLFVYSWWFAQQLPLQAVRCRCVRIQASSV